MRLPPVFVFWLLPLLAPAAASGQTAAQLPPCGSIQSEGGAPARATLALNGQSEDLVTDGKFGREGGRRDLTLVYNVTGCDMGDSQAKPQQPPVIYPTKTGEQIPDGVIVLQGEPEIDGSVYRLHLRAFAEKFSPGTYSGFVQIKAPWLKTVRTPVTVSRSENNLIVPIMWGLGGALIGVGGLLLTAYAKREKLTAPLLAVGLTAVAAVAVGTGVALSSSYFNQGVWTSSANGWALALSALTAATACGMAGLLKAAFVVPNAGDGANPDPVLQPPVVAGGA
jgi:hypothetical protein